MIMGVPCHHARVAAAAAGAVVLAALVLRRSRRGEKRAARRVFGAAGGFEGRVVLVTGASRGLGLEFVRALLARGAVVYATCRTPANAPALEALACDRLRVRRLDTTSVGDAAAVAEEIVAAGAPLDLLLNNAGVASKKHPVDPILKCDVEDLLRVFSANVGGTISTTNACLPAMVGGARAVVTISSDLGSIENTFQAQSKAVKAGGVGSYRVSKASLNMATRVFAAELASEGYTCVALSPGWVATDMGSAGGRTAPLTPAQSVAGCLDVIAGLDEDDNGSFLNYTGSPLPW